MKKKKYPKRPTRKAPLSTWERYRDRCKEVDKHNAKIEADKKKKAKLIQSLTR